MINIEAIEEEMKEIVKKIDEPYHCFIIIYREAQSKDDMNIKAFGVGCPACAIKVIDFIAPSYTHTGIDETVN